MYLVICIGLIIFVISFSVVFLSHRKKHDYTALYAEGVKNENNGFYKAALENYSTVLVEIKKHRFNEKMEQQLIDKIKVLRSAIEYESH